MSSKPRSLAVAAVAVGVLSAAAAWQGAEPRDKPGELLPVLRGPAPTYWKGNLHTHSLWSDGNDFPEMIADWYKRQGYHFLALTDHNVLAEGDRWVEAADKPAAKPIDKAADQAPEQASEGVRAQAVRKYLDRFGPRWVERRSAGGKDLVRLKPLAEFRSLLEEPGRYLLIPGEEITHRYAKAPVHINAINLRDVIRPLDGQSVTETIAVNHRQVAEQSRRTGWKTIAFLNHPNFQYGVTAEDMVLAGELRFFEVYNGHPGVHNRGNRTHPGTEAMWDIVLALRLGKHRLGSVYALATDDAHAYHEFAVGQSNPGRGWIMVRAPYLTAEAVVRALEAGDFYATTGVTLKDVRRDADRLSLAIDPQPGVRYRTQFLATMKDAALASEPRKDADGKPLDVTRLYGPDVGRVVAETDDLAPSYRLTGRELYVRARVTSTKPHPNPSAKGEYETAWTQPLVPAPGVPHD